MKKILLPLIIVLGVTFGLASWERTARVSAETRDVYRDLETFSNVLSIIQKSYVEDVDPEQVISGAIKGMLSSLDPHSSFLKPDDFKELQVETKGEFSGIGIEITTKDDILTVVSPIEGTPAFEKGIEAGDRIIKIEGESTKDMTLMEAVKKLRGQKGTTVTISIHREGWTELKDITIIRDVIPIHSVKSKILEPGYAYIRVTNFQAQTSDDLKNALGDLKKDGEVRGLILDLRNNPGGLLDQAVKVSDVFLDDGLIVFTKGRLKDQNMTFKAHSNGEEYTFPIVVLVNEGTASASEIVAGALQDHRRALILGAQTFGKGSVQTIIPMEDGSGLRLTTARYYTPNGTSIQAKGITPDIMVPSRLSYAMPDKKEENGSKVWFMREKDLKRHISNGQESKDESDQPDAGQNGNDMEGEEEDGTVPPEGETPAGPDGGEQAPDKLEDPQLHTALLMLKGLNVLAPGSSSGIEVIGEAKKQ